MVLRASKESKGLSGRFCMLFGYVKRGLRLSKDSFTTSISGYEICNGGLAGSNVWFSIVSMSKGVILSIIYVIGSVLG